MSTSSTLTTNALDPPNVHYAAISFYQGPFNHQCIHVVGITTTEIEQILNKYGKNAVNRETKYVDIVGYTALEVANYLAEQFMYRIISTSGTQGEFCFVMERPINR